MRYGKFESMKLIQRHTTDCGVWDYEFMAMEVQLGKDNAVLVSWDSGETWEEDPCADFYPFAGGITYVLLE